MFLNNCLKFFLSICFIIIFIYKEQDGGDFKNLEAKHNIAVC